MKSFLASLLLLACGGPSFTSNTGLENEKGINAPATGGHSGTLASAGTASVSGSAGSSAGGMGTQSGQGGMANSSSGANAGGDSSMAGGPAMGQGGNSGEPAMQNVGGGSILSQCLGFWQNLDCARVCTNSQSDCQSVINCYVTTGSIDNCTAFTSIGISLAQSAERACCK